MSPTPRIIMLLAGMLAFAAAQAQDYPSRTVRIIVAAPPGGVADLAARVVGQKLSDAWGQPVIVDNRPGAGGVIGTDVAAKSAPDGYTLLMGTFSEFAINPAIYPNLPYNLTRDFAPITIATVTPMVLVASANSPFGTVKELIAAAKSRPGEIGFASPGNGTMNHLTGEWFAAETGIKLLHIPYKGSPPATNGVIAGEVPLAVLSFSAAQPFVKAGKLKALAVTTAKRTALAPDWPTVAELGVQDFDAVILTALYAPAATPKNVIAKINADTIRTLGLSEVRERFAAQGAEPTGSTPEELAAAVKAATARFSRIVEQAKIKAQ